MSFIVTASLVGGGFVGGVVLSTVFWVRKLRELHAAWQANFSSMVGATVAYYLGGRIDENGIIHLGEHEEVPPKEGLN